jgi:hypothetical protein
MYVTHQRVCMCPQVWFPADWATRLSSFNSVTTFAYLLLLLTKAPAVAFTSSSFSSWAPQGVLVSIRVCVLKGMSTTNDPRDAPVQTEVFALMPASRCYT